MALLIGFQFAILGPSGYADDLDFADQTELIRRLVSPARLLVDGKPFREALERVATEADINLCLDRHVDPTKPVSLGPLGPTTYLAIEQLARSRDCVTMPIANVLLIGRADWVDQTVASIVALELDGRMEEVTDVQWPDLTTPKEAVQAVMESELAIADRLPHDLWPSSRWSAMERSVALTLVLAQLNRRPQLADSSSVVSIEKLPISFKAGGPQITRSYAFGSLNRVFAKSFRAADTRSQSNREGRLLTATGSVAAHRQAIASVLSSVRVEPSDIDEATFTIKRMRTSATNAFRQFAKMAGRECVIDPNASQACAAVVSLEGSDLTLRQLTERVAEQVGVVVDWSNDAIIVSRDKP